MRAGSDLKHAIAGAMAGLLYGAVLAFVSLFAAGGGHGTIIPLLWSSAPLGVFSLVGWRVGALYVGDSAIFLSAPLLWAALGALATLSGRGRWLRLTQGLVLLHYASGLALVAATGAELADLARDGWVTIYVAVWATVYLAGQVALWWRLARRNQLRSTA